MDASALDELLAKDDGRWDPTTARAELAALRARVEAAELVMRWLAHPCRTISCSVPFGSKDLVWWFDMPGEWRGMMMRVETDGTGLPLLTAEARRALRGENKGKVST